MKLTFQDSVLSALMLSVFGYGVRVFATKSTVLQLDYYIYLLMIGGILYIVTCKLITRTKDQLEKAGLVGLDINKKGTPEGEVKIPESLGIIPVLVYLCFNCVLMLYCKLYLPEFVIKIISATLSISFMGFLGFCDDVIDIRWRIKLWLPFLAVVPCFVASSGVTHIVVPYILQPYFGQVVELGLLYYLIMILIAVFCTHSINIYAGINGLEVGQSLVIACSILVHNLMQINRSSDQNIILQHHYSLFIIIPYIFVTLGLYKYNKYPSKVFVGDTFTYWSGMVFAVCGILGYFTKSLMLFFIPQLLNFLYSVPQLFGFIKCPRHRLTRYNVETKKLEGIKTNLNLINLMLIIFGPMTEQKLTCFCICFQIFCSMLGFFFRYLGASYFFFTNS